MKVNDSVQYRTSNCRLLIIFLIYFVYYMRRFPAIDMLIWQLHELIILFFQKTNIMTYYTEMAYIYDQISGQYEHLLCST